MKFYLYFVCMFFFFFLTMCSLPAALNDPVPHDLDKMVLLDFLAHDYYTLLIRSISPTLFAVPTTLFQK